MGTRYSAAHHVFQNAAWSLIACALFIASGLRGAIAEQAPLAHLKKVVVSGARPDKGDAFSLGLSGSSAPGRNTGSGGSGSGSGATATTLQDPNQEGGDHTDPCMTTGNPVRIASGNKFKQEVDIRTSHLYPLELVRNYNYNFTGRGLFGRKWASSFDEALSFTTSDGVNCGSFPGYDASACVGTRTVSKVTVNRSDGSQQTYTRNAVTGRYDGATPDVEAWAVKNGDGTWTLQNKGNAVESYSAEGRILSNRDPTGIGWTFSYNGSYLSRATHSNGQYFQFAWGSNGRVVSVTDPANRVYSYGYTSSGYLSSVSYPTSPASTRTYFYENASLPDALTGISVNGVRYSTYSYQPDGKVATSGLLDGQVEKMSFAYTSSTTQVTNAGGAVATYTFQTINGDKKPVRVDQSGITSCPNTVATTHYDTSGHRDYSFDQRGIKTTYRYSSTGFLENTVAGIDVNNPNQQREIQYTWDTSKNRILSSRQVAANGAAISSVTYNYWSDTSPAKNRLQSIVTTNLTSNGVPNQTQTRTFNYSFYTSGLPSQIIENGPSGQITENYSLLGNLNSIVNAAGQTVSYSGYDAYGLPATQTDPNGFVQTYAYDVRGRMTSVSRTLEGIAAATTFTYNGLDKLLKISYAGGGYVQYTYDGAGRRIKLATDLSLSGTRQLSAERAYAYNNFSRITTDTINQAETDYQDSGNGVQTIITNSTPYRHTWTYDSLGRMLSSQGVNGQNLRYAYDANGNIATVTDSLNKITRYEYNAFDQVQKTTDPLNGITRFEYDGAGNLSAVVDPKGNRTQYSYDGLGNLVAQNSPDTSATTYSYDDKGRLTLITLADGSQTMYSHDSLNRVSQVQAGNQTIIYTYDNCINGVTRLCSFSDASGSTRYSYRQNGQTASQTSVISGTSYVTSWSYDNRDRMTSITYPGGNQARYSYDSQSNVTGVALTAGGVNTTLVSQMVYKAATLGPLSNMRLGTRDHSFGYDTDFRLASIGTTGIQSLQYSFDANDRVAKVTDYLNSSQTQTYGYDNLSRLSSVTSGIGNQSFGLDANGNRTSHGLPNGVNSYTVESASNRVTSINTPNPSSPIYYQHDAIGNRTQTHYVYQYIDTYGYDTFKRMNRVDHFDGANTYTTNYSINALNQRNYKSGPNGTYAYVHDADGVLLNETSGAGTSTQYI